MEALNFMLVAETNITSDVSDVLIENEKAIAAYKTFRDTAIFTNKRIIIKDSQGLTGKKVEIYSIPFSSINMWSSENSGHLDFSSELELWTRAGNIKIKLSKGLDIRKLDKMISEGVLK